MNNYRCYIFCGDKLLLHVITDGTIRVPMSYELPATLLEKSQWQSITVASGNKVYGCMVSESDIPVDSRWQLIGRRDSYALITEHEYAEAGKVWQILYWDEHSHYCPKCGKSMVRCEEIMKRCPRCGFEMYPVVSPAVIVRITRGDEILLVHARNFRGRFFGLVAGFVESGESLEECVCREVMEETGLTIENIRYFGSQTWPYPSNLMVGFTADYHSGNIKLQDTELSAGAFYSRDKLPELPRKPSIARSLIDDWLECQQ